MLCASFCMQSYQGHGSFGRAQLRSRNTGMPCESLCMQSHQCHGSFECAQLRSQNTGMACARMCMQFHQGHASFRLAQLSLQSTRLACVRFCKQCYQGRGSFRRAQLRSQNTGMACGTASHPSPVQPSQRRMRSCEPIWPIWVGMRACCSPHRSSCRTRCQQRGPPMPLWAGHRNRYVSHCLQSVYT